MKLTICTQRLSDAPVPLGINSVCFTAGGRKAFEITLLDDGGIEVRGCPTEVLIDGVRYSEMLSIRPRVSNSIEIRLVPREAAHG